MIMPYQVIDKSQSAYPSVLRHDKQSPHTLYCQGDCSLLNTPSVAIVGTRSPTPLGKRIAFSIAAYFASQGYTIVSGLALGCDTAAHQGALSVGGKTIAVLGTTLHECYPRENLSLMAEIAEKGGLLVTEYDRPARDPQRFVVRDAIQAALCLAVIPVQMSEKSGTRHAVAAARALGRQLFLPIPTDKDEASHPAQYAGIRALLREGRGVPFKGREDYPHLLEILAQH